MGISITVSDIDKMNEGELLVAIEIIKSFVNPVKYAERDLSGIKDYVVPMEPEIVPEARFAPRPDLVTLGDVPKAWPFEGQQSNGIEVDSTGLPWDGRIHASSRSKNGDQSWRLRRGVDDAVVSAVTRELQQTMGMPISEPAPIPMAPPPTQLFAPVPHKSVVPPPPFVLDAVQSAPQVPSLPLPTVVPVTIVETVSHSKTFAELMIEITRAYQAGTITKEAISNAVQSVGLPSLPMLASRPDLVQGVATALGILL